MEGLSELKRLLDTVAGRITVEDSFRKRMDLLSPEARAEDFKRIAKLMDIDPEIVDNFDLAGIETKTIQGFFEEVQARFFEEPSLGPER
ncbi:hypothetical protein A2V61_04260 [Candidatus Woesebacteria bacterium RBG_19FT_COMBO_47_8]|uniref:Uncharacterized protein n=1 Tax=Candidatus Woesebacteria bacterium RBG_13_46_13 TaxID=1802479 RepID=A0A1F7X564_9BACT|nr:MAG: hypothetical protein A2Y68_01150 [Candidatus Woesebacteria bacterium RBG_13_46_13]OGM17014.1 MAG: hypothetical protein A2V61_04260 [Candidatus Woesebacteria bacterium RBG_19FT_COMBO_47_8]